MKTSRQQSISIKQDANTFSIKMTLQATVYEESPGMYVSHCEALDLCSQGETPEEAEKNIIEASELLLTDCFEHGTLNEVLADCGFRSILEKPRTKKHASAIPKQEKNCRQVTFPADLPVLVYG